MNTYQITDENYINSKSYKNFIKQNPSHGYLKIRAYSASQAIPIKGLKIVVSSIIDNNNIIFFEGYTDDSGTIEKINLPAPKSNDNNLDAPKKTVYDIKANYIPDNISFLYKVNMYEDICVVQNINIVPDMNLGTGGF